MVIVMKIKASWGPLKVWGARGSIPCPPPLSGPGYTCLVPKNTTLTDIHKQSSVLILGFSNKIVVASQLTLQWKVGSCQ